MNTQTPINAQVRCMIVIRAVDISKYLTVLSYEYYYITLFNIYWCHNPRFTLKNIFEKRWNTPRDSQSIHLIEYDISIYPNSWLLLCVMWIWPYFMTDVVLYCPNNQDATIHICEVIWQPRVLNHAQLGCLLNRLYSIIAKKLKRCITDALFWGFHRWWLHSIEKDPDSKVHGANMGLTWACRP